MTRRITGIQTGLVAFIADQPRGAVTSDVMAHFGCGESHVLRTIKAALKDGLIVRAPLPAGYGFRYFGSAAAMEAAQPWMAEQRRAFLAERREYSDDNVELRGAINDEIGAWDGTTIAVTRSGLLHKWPDDEPITKAKAKLYFAQEAEGVATIKAIWCPPKTELSWGFETQIPHSTFDVMEDGEVFCRGIVFALADVATVTPETP